MEYEYKDSRMELGKIKNQKQNMETNCRRDEFK